MKPFEVDRKRAKKAAAAATQLTSSLSRLSSLENATQEQPSAVLAAATEARDACRALQEFTCNLDPLAARLEPLLQEATELNERMRGRMIAELDELLRADGLKLEGRIPNLRCGALTLELRGGVKPDVRIHYGPRLSVLATVPCEAKAIASQVRVVQDALEGETFEDAPFLEELRSAWRAAVARAGGVTGEKAPIVAILSEMAVGRQGRAWLRNPDRSHFAPYSLVQFSYDLGRLRSRRLGDEELVLTVATRDQTRSRDEHLWVAGTHYAWLAFR
jgi:hypothetical protein